MLKRLLRLATWAMLIAAVVAGIVLTARYRQTRQVREALYEAFDPVAIVNCTLQRYGSANDGGYLMCANLLPPSQAAYSYGIGGDDAWGCDVRAATGIPVHQYDCFDVRVPPCAGGGTVFHAECVGDRKADVGGRAFDTMAGQVDANGDTGRRLVVKMDVEGAEWRSLLAAPDHILAAIDQMAVEFHEVEDPAFLDTARRLGEFFYVAHVHQNNFQCGPGFDPFPGPVFEVLLVNKRVAVANPWERGRRVSALDAPNTPRAADCQTVPARSAAGRVWQWLRRLAREAAGLVTRRSS